MSYDLLEVDKNDGSIGHVGMTGQSCMAKIFSREVNGVTGKHIPPRTNIPGGMFWHTKLVAKTYPQYSFATKIVAKLYPWYSFITICLCQNIPLV